MLALCLAGMGMSQADAVAGGRRPVVKGSMGVNDIDLDGDVCYFAFYSQLSIFS